MDKKDLVERVVKYLSRVGKSGDYVNEIPLEQEGIYRFLGGTTSESGFRPEVGYFKGRYIDVVAMAIAHPKYGGWYCDSKNAELNRHGYLTAVEQNVEEVPKMDGLVGYVNRTLGLQKEKEALEEELERQTAEFQQKIDKLDEEMKK